MIGLVGEHSGLPEQAAETRIRFCSRCAATSDGHGRTGAGRRFNRVCDGCGMGVMLTCAAEMLPSAGAAFLVVTGDLRVSALSESAERIFGREAGVVDQPVTAILSAVDPDGALEPALRRAAAGAGETASVPVRAAGRRRGGTLSARIGTCELPRAALVVLERVARDD